MISKQLFQIAHLGHLTELNSKLSAMYAAADENTVETTFIRSFNVVKQRVTNVDNPFFWQIQLANACLKMALVRFAKRSDLTTHGLVELSDFPRHVMDLAIRLNVDEIRVNTQHG